MGLKKPVFLKYLNILLLVFFSASFIGSQFSVALSSIGVGGLIILSAVKIAVDRNIKVVDKKIIYLLGLYLLIQIIFSFFSAEPGESFSNVFRRASLYPVFFATFLFIEDLEQLKKILMGFLLFTALVCSVEIVRYFIDFFAQTEKPLSEFRLEYYGYPLTNGEIKMLIVLIIVPLIFLKEKFVFNRLILILILIPVFVSLFLTDSRNAFLGVFAGLLIIGFLKNKYFLAGLIAAVALFIVLAPSALKERVVSIVDINQQSNHARIIMWETGVRMAEDHPAIGFGDIDINKIYARYKKPEIHGEGAHMHNNFFQILVMFGFAGFLMWLWGMIYIFIKQIKIYRLTKKYEVINTLALISMVSMVAFQISGLTEWNFGDAEFAVVLWFNLGLIFLAQKLYLNKVSEHAGA